MGGDDRRYWDEWEAASDSDAAAEMQRCVDDTKTETLRALRNTAKFTRGQEQQLAVNQEISEWEKLTA